MEPTRQAVGASGKSPGPEGRGSRPTGPTDIKCPRYPSFPARHSEQWDRSMSSVGELQPVATPMQSAIHRYFEVSLYLMVLTGFGSLASTGSLGLVTVLLVSAALLIRGCLLIQCRTWLIAERWTTLLTLGYVTLYLGDYFLFSGGFLNATVHLVLFVMVVLLFSAQRDRDFYLLSVIAFLMVLSAALLTVDSVFLLTFAGFMLTAVVAFILMEMRH